MAFKIGEEEGQKYGVRGRSKRRQGNIARALFN
jgi:hypothetical protein